MGRIFSVIFLILLLFIGGRPAALAEGARCPEVAETRQLNILTVNILFSEFEQLEGRLQALASFVITRDIHVVLLQEVVGGLLASHLAAELGNTKLNTNTARKLQRILAEQYGSAYDLSLGFSNGLPGILGVYNAILSRCEILGSLVRKLPRATEFDLEGHGIKLGRSVLVSQLDLPSVGTIDVYNTHLCSDCSSEDRFAQGDALIRFLLFLEEIIPGQNPVILGGDFNTDLVDADPKEQALYDMLTDGANLVDSYFQFTNPAAPVSCIRTAGGVLRPEGCTIGVSFVDDPFGTSAPKRIDYLFTRGLQIAHSEVVFNPKVPGRESQPSVSDHSGVLTSVMF